MLVFDVGTPMSNTNPWVINMYEMAKRSREAMKSKARRLAGASDQKVDSSDWSPAPMLRAEMKTGARPITGPSKKGIGESNKAADTKSALGSAHRGAFKDGGGVKNKKALGAIDPTPKRGPAGHYKRGGKAEGGKLPSPYEAMRSEERRGSVKVEEKRQLPPPKEAAESAARTGDVPEGRKKGGKAVRKGRKHGGAAPNLTVIVADKGQSGAMSPMSGRGGVMPVMTPPAGAASQMPPPAPMAPPVGAPPPAGMPPLARKSGGRITKVASSYKDMGAGAGSGEGRFQKTDIAKKHKDAPARRFGGRAGK